MTGGGDLILNEALRYAGDGVSVFPVNPANKRPLIETWEPYQTRAAAEDVIEGWWNRWPNANVAIVTGQVSGVVVVDTDNDEAERWWRAHGIPTPAVVKTRKGRHFYYRWPGYEVRNRANWNGVKGLDVRGDGGYVVAPPSKSTLEDGTPANYSWEEREDFDALPDFDPHIWSKISDERALPGLTGVDVEGATASSKLENQPKLKDGDGRNMAMTEFVGERVKLGLPDDDVWRDMLAFEGKFFADPLPDEEKRTILSSIRRKDRANHPERYDPNTGEVDVVVCPDGVTRPRRIPGMLSANDLIATPLPPRKYLMEPWLESPGITQVFGYSGDGKTLFTLGGAYCLAVGKDFGPYRAADGAKRVLYCDYDMGSHDMQQRLSDFKAMFGDAGDRFQVLSLSLMGDDVYEMDIRKKEGLNALMYAISRARCDVVVLDNMRSMCPGMKENDSDQWSAINNGLIALRNQTGIGIIYVHHSNKPQRDQKGNTYRGSEAGSSNQLTPLEVQVSISRLAEPPVFDPDSDYGKLQTRIENENLGQGGAFIRHAIVAEYGKVRNRDPGLHTTEFLAFGRTLDGTPAFTASLGNRKRAVVMQRQGHTVAEICRAMKMDRATVEDWLGLKPRA